MKKLVFGLILSVGVSGMSLANTQVIQNSTNKVVTQNSMDSRESSPTGLTADCVGYAAVAVQNCLGEEVGFVVVGERTESCDGHLGGRPIYYIIDTVRDGNCGGTWI